MLKNLRQAHTQATEIMKNNQYLQEDDDKKNLKIPAFQLKCPFMSTILCKAKLSLAIL